ncbi:MAG: 5-formyltetrahydrofolate cyclo-ligase [Hyphomicrobiales bacterium]|nr:5-formyltetrahydrofolate cyclo-ligase [Hyphomicrobiales bacterium]MDE1974753.1 5-formyltetrahydrofolate cyclo-ligase [Hyphomicrobiales bacterium]
MNMTSHAEDLKTTLRREVIARRDALPAVTRKATAETLASRPFPLAVTPGMVVSAFMPLKNELDPQQLMRKLAEEGVRFTLPVVIGRGKPLAMREWAFGEPLVQGVWGIREPAATAATVDPDILLVPIVAFDRTGHRIGYGAGYYDMTITQLRARKQVVAVGLAFATQEVSAVPATPRDARLDLVLTEREVIDLRGR